MMMAYGGIDIMRMLTVAGAGTQIEAQRILSLAAVYDGSRFGTLLTMIGDHGGRMGSAEILLRALRPKPIRPEGQRAFGTGPVDAGSVDAGPDTVRASQDPADGAVPGAGFLPILTLADNLLSTGIGRAAAGQDQAGEPGRSCAPPRPAAPKRIAVQHPPVPMALLDQLAASTTEATTLPDLAGTGRTGIWSGLSSTAFGDGAGRPSGIAADEMTTAPIRLVDLAADAAPANAMGWGTADLPHDAHHHGQRRRHHQHRAGSVHHGRRASGSTGPEEMHHHASDWEAAAVPIGIPSPSPTSQAPVPVFVVNGRDLADGLGHHLAGQLDRPSRGMTGPDLRISPWSVLQ